MGYVRPWLQELVAKEGVGALYRGIEPAIIGTVTSQAGGVIRNKHSTDVDSPPSSSSSSSSSVYPACLCEYSHSR
jgi:hypothetical protein